MGGLYGIVIHGILGGLGAVGWERGPGYFFFL